MLKHKWIHQNAKRVLSIFFLGVLLSSTIIAAFIFYRVTYQEMQKLKVNHANMTRLIQENYQSKLQSLIQKGDLIAHDSRLQKLEDLDKIDYDLHGIPLDYEYEKRRLFDEIRKLDATISAVFIMSSKGEMYMVEPFETQLNLSKSVFRDREYYSKVMETHETVISETFVGADGFKIFVVATPILDESGEVSALLGQVYHLSNLNKLFPEQFLQNVGTSVMLDNNGELVRLMNDTLDLRNEGASVYIDELNQKFAHESQLLLEKSTLNGQVFYLSKTTLDNGWVFYLLKEDKVIKEIIYKTFWDQMLFIFIVILMVTFFATYRIYRIEKMTSENEKLILTKELHRIKNMETELREKHSLYHQLFKKNASPMLLINKKTLTIIEGNQAAAHFYGVPVEALKGYNLTKFTRKSEKVLRQELEDSAVQKMGYFTSKHLNAEGEYRDVEIYSGPVYHKKEIVICAVVHDVTLKNQMQTQMQKAIDHYLTILDDFPTLIWRVDLDGDYDYFNKTWLNYTGCQMEEEIGDGWLENMHPDDFKPYMEAFNQAFKERDHFMIEMRLKDVEGNYRWMLNRGRPYYDLKGQFSGFIGTCVDIHDIKQMEMKLTDSAHKAEEYNQLKDKFLANMSHEVRTPISGIVGITELMLKTEKDEKKFDQLNLIRNSAYNLLDLVNDLLDLSKIESGNFELNLTIFNLNDLMINVIKLFDAKIYEKGIELRFTIDDAIPYNLFGDPMRLKQILVNLVGNAIKFTDEGYVEIKAKLIEKHKEKLNIEFVVSDTGIGISEENRERVLEEFVQDDKTTVSRFGGTGLGLSIVRNLVEMMGGTIVINSKIDEGTEVHFNVFLKDYGFDSSYETEENHELDEITKAVEKTAFPLRVLIAEDNRINQLFISSLCRDVFGDEADVVDDGIEALEKVKEHAYDCLLLDKNMPGLSGLQVTQQIKQMEDKSNIPIILITAAKLVDERESILTSGIDYYLSKPVDQKHLREILDQIRERKYGIVESSDQSQLDQVSYEYVNRQELLDVSQSLGNETVVAMIKEFLEGYEQLIEMIRVDVIESEFERLDEDLHNLKGSIGYFNTTTLMTCIENLQDAVNKKDSDRAGHVLGRLMELMNHLKVELLSVKEELEK